MFKLLFIILFAVPLIFIKTLNGNVTAWYEIPVHKECHVTHVIKKGYFRRVF